MRLPSLGHEPYDACLRRLGPSPCGRWPEGGASRTQVLKLTASTPGPPENIGQNEAWLSVG